MRSKTGKRVAFPFGSKCPLRKAAGLGGEKARAEARDGSYLLLL
jgi:hypothetical protein